MKLAVFISIFLSLTINLSAQVEDKFIKNFLAEVFISTDPNNQFMDLTSIYYQGNLMKEDTSQIEFFKLLPNNFKSHTYKKKDSLLPIISRDSVTSIVNSNGYFQYREGMSLNTERSSMDQDVFYDLFKFDINYAISITLNDADIQLISENDSIIVLSYQIKPDQLYKIKLDKNYKRIVEYSCECLKINYQKGYVRLSNYKKFNNIFFPTRVEFWTKFKLVEVFQYDSISINKLGTNDFIIPKN